MKGTKTENVEIFSVSCNLNKWTTLQNELNWSTTTSELKTEFFNEGWITCFCRYLWGHILILGSSYFYVSIKASNIYL